MSAIHVAPTVRRMGAGSCQVTAEGHADSASPFNRVNHASCLAPPLHALQSLLTMLRAYLQRSLHLYTALLLMPCTADTSAKRRRTAANALYRPRGAPCAVLPLTPCAAYSSSSEPSTEAAVSVALMSAAASVLDTSAWMRCSSALCFRPSVTSAPKDDTSARRAVSASIPRALRRMSTVGLREVHGET